MALEAFGANAEALLPTLANVAAFMGERIPYLLPLHLVEHLPGGKVLQMYLEKKVS